MKDKEGEPIGILKNKSRLQADSAAVFLLGAVFLFLSIGLVLLGGSVYSQTLSAASENDELRTTFSYIANQIRRADSHGAVETGRLDAVPALLLNQDFEGIACVTYLYYWEGSLRELFVEKDTELGPEAGLPLIELAGLDFQMDDQGLLTIEAAFDSGGSQRMLLSCRSQGREAGSS